MKKLFPLLIVLAVLWMGCNVGSDTGNSDPGSPGVEEKILYVWSGYTGDVCDGTKNKPIPDISDAIVIARNFGQSKIYVAVGDYETEEGIELVEGVSLYGGFNPYTWSRYDVETEAGRQEHSTTITSTSTEDSCKTIFSGPGVTKDTILEGVTIKGGNPSVEMSTSVQSLNTPILFKQPLPLQ